jgi:hypothetical protein
VWQKKKRLDIKKNPREGGMKSMGVGDMYSTYLMGSSRGISLSFLSIGLSDNGDWVKQYSILRHCHGDGFFSNGLDGDGFFKWV